jgi:hypothetical protein
LGRSWQRCDIDVTTFNLKAVGGQLAFTPIGAATTLGSQLKACTGICYQIIDFLAAQRAANFQLGTAAVHLLTIATSFVNARNDLGA